ncbi:MULTISPECIES: amino acid ABC transporter ATP-binding protein [Bartonella]|uniref:Amino acid ABC transporter ATP-binding protein, PAAT family n=1 Tax=Bartonella choladocola TaxID=2750995 RepID=A0A1U9MJZ1_9HYPH|nr:MULTISPECIES: amino acid ABC transporter ATP-binding protein [Bartonella]AQT48040.1 amino acid ABC transporter ATP-binding protein, PAAT family [Bartonella choladocola]MBH9975943.1 amino acid ABC transporter ATP-binding protein [Bartonella choladocola]MBI0015715.1 amino acid ABC transporter ATP-binding protein [Bartonella sp. B10834G3]
MEAIDKTPLISMKDVRKSYGALDVLKGINVDMTAGERLVVIGPSGGGKSTLLRVVMGLEEIKGGTVALEGSPYISVNPKNNKTVIDTKIRRSIGMVFQHYTLFPHLNILDNLILAPVKINKEAKASAIDRAMELLERFGLASKAKVFPAQLSGGQKQRVAIARALMLDPKLLLFDEVTSALDPELVSEIENVMMDLAEQSLPMMIVTHDMGFARNIASRVIFCAGGVVVEDGPREQVLGTPENERTREFIKRVFRIGE